MGIRKLIRRTRKYSPKRRRSKNNLRNKKQRKILTNLKEEEPTKKKGVLILTKLQLQNLQM